jgi:hypothetical protein
MLLVCHRIAGLIRCPDHALPVQGLLSSLFPGTVRPGRRNRYGNAEQGAPALLKARDEVAHRRSALAPSPCLEPGGARRVSVDRRGRRIIVRDSLPLCAPSVAVLRAARSSRWFGGQLSGRGVVGGDDAATRQPVPLARHPGFEHRRDGRLCWPADLYNRGREGGQHGVRRLADRRTLGVPQSGATGGSASSRGADARSRIVSRRRPEP